MHVKPVLSYYESLWNRMTRIGLDTTYPIVVEHSSDGRLHVLRWKRDPVVRHLVDNKVIDLSEAKRKLDTKMWSSLLQRLGYSLTGYRDSMANLWWQEDEEEQQEEAE